MESERHGDPAAESIPVSGGKSPFDSDPLDELKRQFMDFLDRLEQLELRQMTPDQQARKLLLEQLRDLGFSEGQAHFLRGLSEQVHNMARMVPPFRGGLTATRVPRMTDMDTGESAEAPVFNGVSYGAPFEAGDMRRAGGVIAGPPTMGGDPTAVLGVWGPYFAAIAPHMLKLGADWLQNYLHPAPPPTWYQRAFRGAFRTLTGYRVR